MLRPPHFNKTSITSITSAIVEPIYQYEVRGVIVKASRGYAMVLVAALMWGSIGIFVKNLTALGLTSASIAALRLLMGALLLIPVLMFIGARAQCAPGGRPSGPLALFRADCRSLVSCAFVGIVGLACANFLYYLSMGEVGMSTASVLLYTSPVFGVALGRLLYAEPVSANKAMAVVVNIVGCVLAVTNGDLSGLGFSPVGVGCGVLAGFMGALLAVFSKSATERMHPLAVTFYGFIFGGVAMAAIAFPWTDIAAALSPQLLIILIAFGLIPTALAYIFYMTGLSMGLEASKVPVVASFETVATVLVGVLLYGEGAGPVKVMGICLVLLSIFVMNMDFARLRASSVASRWQESMQFNGGAWRREKLAVYNEFIDGGDWQSWIAPR